MPGDDQGQSAPPGGPGVPDGRPAPPTPPPPGPAHDWTPPSVADGWVPPAPPPPRGDWTPPAAGDPQPYAAAYQPRPGYDYTPPPAGVVQPTYQPGLGAYSVLPPGVRRWNWGAFFFTWIWGLFNGAYVTLWGLLAWVVPFGGLVWSIVCGMNGDRWAWQGKAWESPEHFRATQHAWAVAALVLFLIGVLASILIVVLLTAGVLTAHFG